MRPAPSGPAARGGPEISPRAHLVGPVVLGRQVTIEAGAVVVGPAVLCDGCTVGRDAVVDSAIVGAGVSVEPNRSLEGCVVTGVRPTLGCRSLRKPRRAGRRRSTFAPTTIACFACGRDSPMRGTSSKSRTWSPPFLF